jgi:L-alanine-DL-glutamate epimerase-like enolase superfamily enzyme
MALAFDIDLAHHEEGHIAAHLLASMPNGTFVEAFTPQRDPIFWNLLVNRKPLQDGQLLLPDGPGLGWTLDDDFIRRYRVDS